MSERDDRYARNDVPSSTAEFRAVPDISASTAQFKAFAAGRDAAPDQSQPGNWPEQPWAGDAPTRGGGRRTALIVSAVVAAVVVVVIVIVLTVG